MTAIPRDFDAVFAKYGGDDLPVSFLRSLSWNESKMTPRAKASGSSARGLFMVSLPVLKDFNAERGTNVTAEALLDPNANTRVATWQLRRIIKTYEQTNPFLRPDWRSPAWVALLTLGWTAGWSTKQGVAGLVGRMLGAGIPPEKISLDTVIQAAGRLYPKSKIYAVPSPGPYMSDPKLKHWVLLVLRDYFDQLQGGESPLPQKPPEDHGVGVPLVAFALIGLGVGVFAYKNA